MAVAYHRHHLFGHLVEVGGDRVGRWSPREIEQIAADVDAALDLLIELLELGGLLVGPGVPPEHLHERRDGSEGGAYFMSEAGGHSAECGKAVLLAAVRGSPGAFSIAGLVAGMLAVGPIVLAVGHKMCERPRSREFPLAGEGGLRRHYSARYSKSQENLAAIFS